MIQLAIAGIVTAFLYAWTHKFTSFVETNYNTQAFVDPESVPPLALNNEADAATLAMTNLVKIPMAQIASGFGEELSLNRLNPSVPPQVFGNSGLDTPNPTYKQGSFGAV